MDITKLLKHDHDEVRALFKEFFALGEDAKTSREQIAAKICKALEVHTRIEEELFYPELETATETADEVREAYVEHKQAKTLIAEIKRMRSTAEDFDAKMKVLHENIEHHATEEEKEMLPDSKDVLDADEREAIGEEAAAMKQRLMGAIGDEIEEQPEASPPA